MNNELRFFGTDEYKGDFVIFEMVREAATNIYFWVAPEGNGTCEVRLYPVTRLFSYSEHMYSPYWVKEDDVEQLIDEALKDLEEMPRDEMMEKIEAFDKRYNPEGKPESFYEETDRMESGVWEEVQQARSGSGYWPWTPRSENE